MRRLNSDKDKKGERTTRQRRSGSDGGAAFVAPTAVGGRSYRRFGSRSSAAVEPVQIQFVTAKPCPYAQRVWIALEELGVDYELVEVDLYGGPKPSWFLRANPQGKVPVLMIHTDKSDADLPHVVTESNAICCYVAENLAPGSDGASPPLPCSETEREWQDWVDKELGKHGRERVTRGSTGSSLSSDKLENSLSKVEQALKQEGPYLCGQLFSVADISLYPFLSRLEESYDFPAGRYGETLEYLRRLESRPSIHQTKPAAWWWWW